MIKGLLLLLVMQATGDLLQQLWLPMLPGPVVGLLLLLVFLLLMGRIPVCLEQISSVLFQYLPLLLAVPATGILLGGDVLLAQLPAISGGLLLSLLFCIPLCGWMMQRLIAAEADDD